MADKESIHTQLFFPVLPGQVEENWFNAYINVSHPPSNSPWSKTSYLYWLGLERKAQVYIILSHGIRTLASIISYLQLYDWTLASHRGVIGSPRSAWSLYSPPSGASGGLKEIGQFIKLIFVLMFRGRAYEGGKLLEDGPISQSIHSILWWLLSVNSFVFSDGSNLTGCWQERETRRRSTTPGRTVSWWSSPWRPALTFLRSCLRLD